jgi:hypothetical protein
MKIRPRQILEFYDHRIDDSGFGSHVSASNYLRSLKKETIELEMPRFKKRRNLLDKLFEI